MTSSDEIDAEIREEFQQEEREIALGEYMTGSIRTELQRTNGTATCLLTVLSFVGSAAAAVLGATAGDHGAGPVTVTVLASALAMLGLGLVLVLAALRPRLPHTTGNTVTGWPMALANDHARRFVLNAANYPDFLRRDAETLARIARRKFVMLRAAYTATMLGLPLLLLGTALFL